MNPLFSSPASKSVLATLLALTAGLSDGTSVAQAQAADPTGAAALVVTSTADTTANDGVITLREAISTANADGVNSAITFNVGGTIRLSDGLPPLVNDGTLAITGPQTGPQAGLTISGDANNSGANDDGDVSLFRVYSGANVTLSRLSLIGGRAGGSFLAGLFLRVRVAPSRTLEPSPWPVAHSAIISPWKPVVPSSTKVAP